MLALSLAAALALTASNPNHTTAHEAAGNALGAVIVDVAHQICNNQPDIESYVIVAFTRQGGLATMTVSQGPDQSRAPELMRKARAELLKTLKDQKGRKTFHFDGVVNPPRVVEDISL